MKFEDTLLQLEAIYLKLSHQVNDELSEMSSFELLLIVRANKNQAAGGFNVGNLAEQLVQDSAINILIKRKS